MATKISKEEQLNLLELMKKAKKEDLKLLDNHIINQIRDSDEFKS